ncbi:MAG: hypothetical protein ACTSWR_05405 [Candidatus Helarchaeota archaeon]
MTKTNNKNCNKNSKKQIYFGVFGCCNYGALMSEERLKEKLNEIYEILEFNHFINAIENLKNIR